MVISLNELAYFNVKYYIETDDGSIFAMQLEDSYSITSFGTVPGVLEKNMTECILCGANMNIKFLTLESVTFYINRDDGSLHSSVYGIPHFEQPFDMSVKTLHRPYDAVYFLCEEET